MGMEGVNRCFRSVSGFEEMSTFMVENLKALININITGQVEGYGNEFKLYQFMGGNLVKTPGTHHIDIELKMSSRDKYLEFDSLKEYLLNTIVCTLAEEVNKLPNEEYLIIELATQEYVPSVVVKFDDIFARVGMTYSMEYRSSILGMDIALITKGAYEKIKQKS